MKNLLLKLMFAVAIVLGFGSPAPAKPPTKPEVNHQQHSQKKANVVITSLIPQEWEMIENVVPSEFRVKDLEFIHFSPLDGWKISLYELLHRSAELRANLGFMDGKYILKHQAELPIEVRKNQRIIWLTGTILRRPDGAHMIPCLFQEEGDVWEEAQAWREWMNNGVCEERRSDNGFVLINGDVYWDGKWLLRFCSLGDGEQEYLLLPRIKSK